MNAFLFVMKWLVGVYPDLRPKYRQLLRDRKSMLIVSLKWWLDEIYEVTKALQPLRREYYWLTVEQQKTAHGAKLLIEIGKLEDVLEQYREGLKEVRRDISVIENEIELSQGAAPAQT